MVVSSLLSLFLVNASLATGSMFVSPLGSEDSPRPTEQAQPGAPSEEEQKEEPNDPTAKVLLQAPQAIREKFETMSGDALESLAKRKNAGETLSEDEEQVLELVIKMSHVQFESSLAFKDGDVEIGGDLATLHLGSDFRYINATDANKILERWGNPPDPSVMGAILPTQPGPLEDGAWVVFISYAEDGHVKDDDAEDIDYDELLEEMKEANEAGNEQRKEMGLEAIHLEGWAEPPHYRKDIHSLYWAKELSSEGSDTRSLNYAIRVLGREGVLELEAVSEMKDLPTIKPEMEKIYQLVEFKDGNRYSDFNPDIDKVAAYGIGGLVAGKLAMKAGLWAMLLKFLVAAKKFLIIGAVAVGVFFKKLFGGKKDAE